ncbi:hypothetical protein HMPREF9120_01357 [Neisseria sp. oral taxon 020 str. F0370]|nr:hypothetical protein HMPREF9120_01357 [Neisseria sp. oral taxon 020 str. F0370]
MAFPVAAGEFVLNQFVAGFFVGDAQQGFGQTHQCHAFFAGQGKFVHQRVDAAGFGAVGAHLGDEASGEFVGVFTLFFAHLRALQHIVYRFDFVAAVGIGDGLAQGGLRRKGKIKHFLRFSKRVSVVSFQAASNLQKAV